MSKKIVLIDKPTCTPKRTKENTFPTENPRIVFVRGEAEKLVQKIKKQGGLK